MGLPRCAGVAAAAPPDEKESVRLLLEQAARQGSKTERSEVSDGKPRERTGAAGAASEEEAPPAQRRKLAGAQQARSPPAAALTAPTAAGVMPPVALLPPLRKRLQAYVAGTNGANFTVVDANAVAKGGHVQVMNMLNSMVKTGDTVCCVKKAARGPGGVQPALFRGANMHAAWTALRACSHWQRSAALAEGGAQGKPRAPAKGALRAAHARSFLP